MGAGLDKTDTVVTKVQHHFRKIKVFGCKLLFYCFILIVTTSYYNNPHATTSTWNIYSLIHDNTHETQQLYMRVCIYTHRCVTRDLCSSFSSTSVKRC